jgi:hypothetical protein
VYNIQKAVSRLDYAPPLKEIEVTDIKKGLGVFTPQPAKPVSFANLKSNLKKAGYTLSSADINVAGKLVEESGKLYLIADQSGQRFFLTGTITNIRPNESVEVVGNWTTVGTGTVAQETIAVENVRSNPVAMFIRGRFGPADSEPELSIVEPVGKPSAPIRTTSPGLTVFQGGAVTPRIYFIKQHLGDLDVWRQLFNVAVSYTPSPRLQLEVEVPVSRTSFDQATNSGSGSGLGNITVWGKYRFFRKVKTYGDRQASARFGLELPTGSTKTPSQVIASDFVRQQLGSINGGLSPHLDISFSQAGGKVIFGGNVEGILRTERNGFRMGHELRVNTDLEYVIAPKSYPKPGGELFVILESSFVTQARGRLNGTEVAGSSSNVYYLSPGLQYAAKPRFVIEGSIQFPVYRSAGPGVLRTDLNLLLGVKYLF